MRVLVTIKHNGIKKILIPALAKIPEIQFDVVLHNTSGLLPEDDYIQPHMNYITRPDILKYTYPDTSLSKAFKKLGLNFDSYDSFILGGLTSPAMALNEFKKKLIFFLVAPFYRARVPEPILNKYKRTKDNCMIVFSTPAHIERFKEDYSYKYFPNYRLLSHGIRMQSFKPYTGIKEQILTVWGGFDSRIENKAFKFGSHIYTGIEGVNKLIEGYSHFKSSDGALVEEEMRKSLVESRFHLLFMKDQQTIGMIESLRTGIPIVGILGALKDPELFMKYGENGFMCDDCVKLKYNINQLMKDLPYAKKISKNAQATCDSVFNFDRFVSNWKAILTEKSLSKVKLELPDCYKGKEI